MGNKESHLGGKEGDLPVRRQGAGSEQEPGRQPALPAAASASSPEGKDEEIDINAEYTKMGPGGKLGIDDFDLLAVLGKGSFAKVMLVRLKATDELFAMKILKKAEMLRRKQVEHTKTERNVLQSVDHPYIVKLRYAWQTSDKLYVVVDYCPGGELFFWLRAHQTFSEKRVQLYAAELVLALDHLHQKNVVYRDLKPENILLDADGHIQLADFGLSKEHVTSFTPGDGATHTFCGTPEYIAPEVLLQKEGHGKGVDWWSLGTFIYEMMNGLPPFYDQNVETMYKKIMTERLVFPDHFSAEACDLLRGMLTRDPAKRLGAGGAREIMRMPFFASLDWDAVIARQVPAEFTPPTKRAGLQNFDQEFTQEAPVDSYDPKQLSSTAVERANIEGFTFVGDSTMQHK